MSHQAVASLLKEVMPSNKTPFSEKNRTRLSELQNILRNRGWTEGSNLLVDMVVVAERDSAYAERFKKWLDRKGSTILLWELTRRFEGQYTQAIDYDNAKAAIDAASAILRFE